MPGYCALQPKIRWLKQQTNYATLKPPNPSLPGRSLIADEHDDDDDSYHGDSSTRKSSGPHSPHPLLAAKDIVTEIISRFRSNTPLRLKYEAFLVPSPCRCSNSTRLRGSRVPRWYSARHTAVHNNLFCSSSFTLRSFSRL